MKHRCLGKGCPVGTDEGLLLPPMPFLLPWDVNESLVSSLIKRGSPDAPLSRPTVPLHVTSLLSPGPHFPRCRGLGLHAQGLCPSRNRTAQLSMVPGVKA